MLREIREELEALALRREELLKQSVGKIFIRSMYNSDFCIGEGYDTLEDFCEVFFKGNVTKEKILHNIELSVFHADLQPDSDQTTCNIIIDLGDRRIEIIEVPQTLTMPPKLPDLPDLPEIVVLDNPLTEKRKEPAPPYQSKLLTYGKRRKYGKKNCWNRIRSRCW